MNPARLAIRIHEWRNDLALFFEDITGLLPSPDQEKFLMDMQDLNKDRAIISAGRGSGKTLCLAIVALWYVFILPKIVRQPLKVVVLGGSFEQSKNLYNYIKDWSYKNDFIKRELAKDPTMTETLFLDGSSVKALTASEKQVRSPRADLLIVDEAVEAGEELIEASLQIINTSKFPRIILSSTPHEFNSLFVEIWEKHAEHGYLTYNWKAINCNWIKKDTIDKARKLLSSGMFQIEFEGLPYAMVGSVFALDALKKCIIKAIVKADNAEAIMGVDWGFYPAPTCCIVIQRIGEKVRVIHIDSYLREKFENVLDALEATAKTYEVKAVYVDSIPPGEGIRLKDRGLPVYRITFKGEKPLLISNLQALVEQERVEIPEDFYSLIAQMRAYKFDTKREDDFVDAMMLACRGASATISSPEDLRELIYVGRRNMRFKNPFKKDELDPKLCVKCQKNPKYAHDMCMDCWEQYMDTHKQG